MENPFEILNERFDRLETLLMQLIETKPDTGPNSDAPISQKEICEYLGITQPTLIKMRKRKEIPFKRAGARYLYNKADVSAAIEKKGGFK